MFQHTQNGIFQGILQPMIIISTSYYPLPQVLETVKYDLVRLKSIWILLVVRFLKIVMTDFPLLRDLLYKRTLAGGSIGRHPIEIFEVVSCY